MRANLGSRYAKALGFTPGFILRLLVGGALLVSLMGGLLGVELASLVCKTLHRGLSFGANYSQLNFAPSRGAVGLRILLVNRWSYKRARSARPPIKVERVRRNLRTAYP